MTLNQINTADLNKFDNYSSMINDFKSFIKAAAFQALHLAGDLFNDITNDNEIEEQRFPTKQEIVDIASNHFDMVPSDSMGPVQTAVQQEILKHLKSIATDESIVMMFDSSQHYEHDDVWTTFTFKWFEKQ